MSEVDFRDVPLDSGVIILTGGRDVTGNLLLTIPTSKLSEIAEWSTASLSAMFMRMVTIGKYIKTTSASASASNSLEAHQRPLAASTGQFTGRSMANTSTSMACVADLRQASTQTINQLIESLELVEHQTRGTIAAVYFLKPRSKSKSHVLKKLLGIKPSKKRPRVPLFKIALLKTVQDLYTQVDVCHLTLDVCGTLKYSHHAWMHMYDVVVQCIEEGKDTLSKLPSIRDRVDLLQEYEPDNQSSTQLHQLLVDLTEKFQIIVTESSLPSCLNRNKQTLFQLDNATSNSLFSSLHPHLLTGMHTYLRDQYVRLDQWNSSLEETWRITESRFTILIQINKHRERAKEIERKICDHYHPLLREHPIVGRTLSQAELYRAHFTTTLYEPAKELLSQATEILEAVHKLKTSVAMTTQSGGATAGAVGVAGGIIGGGSGGGSALQDCINSADFSGISKCLTVSIQPFTNHMQQLQQIYVGIHIFHLLFEKALNWYKKVLKFLPESILAQCLQEAAASSSSPTSQTQGGSFQHGQNPTSLVFMPAEWLGAVRVFLDRHPPPRVEHIDRLDMSPPYLVDRKLRAQARSLALRLRLLQRLMSNTRLPTKLVAAILTWKVELFGTSSLSHMAEKSSPRSPALSPTKERPRSISSSQRGAISNTPSGAQTLPRKPPSTFAVRKGDHSDVIPDSNSSHHVNISGENHATGSTQPSSMDNTGGNINTHKSSADTVADKRDQSTTMQGASGIVSKVQMRKSSGKSFPRAKSVEFSFNSSSTDGSVFDYEKAVSQAKRSSLLHPGKDARATHHSRLAQRKNKWMSGDLKTMPWVNAAEGFPDQVLSDPSSTSTVNRNDRDRVKRSQVKGSDRDRVSFADDLDGGGGNASGFSDRYSMSFKENATDGDEVPIRVTPGRLKNSANVSEAARQISRANDIHFDADPPDMNQEDLNIEDLSSSDERFIGLSSYVDPLQMRDKMALRYGSVDNLLASTTYYNQDEEETESGIDTTENARLDPYDSVVKKIKAISASELPNLEKLKRVSSLIANSSVANNRNRANEQNKLNSKFAFSTLDLRPIDERDDLNQFQRDESIFHLSTLPISEPTSEKPVSAVMRMKENLAKSMEELNTIYSKNVGLKTPLQSSQVKSNSSPPPKPARRRYVSKLTITPRYMSPYSSQCTTDESKSEMSTAEGDSLPFDNTITTPIPSKPDVIETTPADTSRLEQNPDRTDPVTQVLTEHPKPKQRFNFRSVGRSETAKNEEGSSPDENRQSTSDINVLPDNYPEQSRATTPQRPNSLTFLPGRTFISSPFMKPPMSSFNTGQSSTDIDHSQSNTDTRDEDIIDPQEPASGDKNTSEKSINSGKDEVSDNTTLHNSQHLQHRGSIGFDTNLQSNNQQQRQQQQQPQEQPQQQQQQQHHQQQQYHPERQGRSLLQASLEGTSVDLDPAPPHRDDSMSDIVYQHPWSVTSSKSSMADESFELDRRWPSLSAFDVERLSNEAEIEMNAQNEVANSLRNTQRILEEEEKRRSGLGRYEANNEDDEDEENESIGGDNPVIDLNHSDTVDNGYGSWASKLISQPSTSSEGVDPEVGPSNGPFQILSGSFNNSSSASVISRRRNFAKASDDTSSSEKAHETPWLNSPTGDAPKFE